MSGADSGAVGLRDAAPPSSTLRLEVFASPTRPIPGGDATFSPVTSTLILGDADAVLVDAQFITEDVDALADMVDASGRTLRTIFITHGHADHYFGAGRLLGRFPNARLVATADVAASIAETRDRELKTSTRLFGEAIAHPTALPVALEDDVILLEGHKLTVVDVGQGDIAPTAVLHAASLGAVVAGDVVYNQIHQMMAFGGPAAWDRWIESIDRIERLGARVVVAGHKRPGAPDDDVAGILDGTRAYIRDFAAGVRTSSDAGELIGLMRGKYPDHGNVTTLAFSAAAAFARTS